MADPRVEELLERLYLSQVEGDSASPEPPPAEVLASAESAKLVCPGPTGPVLTDTGRAAAVSIVRRHRLAECLLVNVLAVEDNQADADACRFEHIIEPALEEKMCTLLGHPTTCPHGRPIPPGPCCHPDRRTGGQEVGLLSEGQVGCAGIVVYLSARDQQEVRKLMALGILPGEKIRLLRRFPSYVFQVGLSQFTVDRQLAERIHVRWDQRPTEPISASAVEPPSRPSRHRRGHGHGHGQDQGKKDHPRQG